MSKQNILIQIERLKQDINYLSKELGLKREPTPYDPLGHCPKLSLRVERLEEKIIGKLGKNQFLDDLFDIAEIKRKFKALENYLKIKYVKQDESIYQKEK